MSNSTSSTEGVKHTPFVVVFPRGQLAPKDKERLTKAGIIAVEAETPGEVHQLRLAEPMVCTGLNGDAVVLAALQAMAEQAPASSGGSITSLGLAAHGFIKALAASMKKSTGAQP